MPQFEVCSVVKSKALKASNKDELQKQFTKLGLQFSLLLIWQRIIQECAFTISKCIPENNKQLKQSKQLTKYINIHLCKDINSSETQDFIRSQNPHLLISAFFPQILKENTLNIPERGVINVHPGLLPDYRGAMSYFHVLEQNETQAGVTLHWMDEGIDTGKIISKKNFLIKKHDTQETIMTKAALLESSLLRKIGQRIQTGQPLPSIEVTKKGRYFSMPSKANFKSYFKSRRFFRIRDIIGIVALKPLQCFFKK